jgi:hypothetical protein
MTPSVACQEFLKTLSAISVDDFHKMVLASVALIALFLGPWMQWRIAKKQVQMQSDIAKLQIETQSKIATRQIADNISTKRQSWIDELRKEAAELLTLAGRIQELSRPGVKKMLTAADVAEDFKERMAAEMRAKELATRIRLRLNPNEAEHNKLLDLISELASMGYRLNQQYTPEDEQREARAFNAASSAVATHLQAILKHEWERVKRGDV